MAAPLMSLPTGKMKYVVPWRTRAEFITVFNQLYDSDENQQRNGIRAINVWKSRAGNKLSVAVECTASLIEACLEHKEAEREGTLALKEHSLKYTYGLTIIRFVNRVTEKGQTKSIAKPVHEIAKTLGIPEWVVRLRHDATHGNLPCLGILAASVQWALAYLKEKFWDLQTKSHPVKKKKKKNAAKMEDIRACLKDFQNARIEELVSCTVKEDGCEKANSDEHLGALVRLLQKNRLRFIQCLLESGNMIPTTEKLLLFGQNKEDLLLRSPPTLPKKFNDVWLPLLKEMSSTNVGALSLLLHIALSSVTDVEVMRNRALIAWIYFILSCSEGIDRNCTKKKKCHKTIFPTVPRKTLLALCLQNINKLTTHLLVLLADRKEMGEEKYLKLSKLFDLAWKMKKKAGEEDEEDDLSPDGEGDGQDLPTIVYTIEDVKQAMKTGEDVEDWSTTATVPWVMCTEPVDWETVPLGFRPPFDTGDNIESNDDGGEEGNKSDSSDGDEVNPEKMLDDSLIRNWLYTTSSDEDGSAEDSGGGDDNAEYFNKQSSKKRKNDQDDNRDNEARSKLARYFMRDEVLL